MFDNGNEIGYRDVDLLDTYFSATTKTLTNKTLTSPTVSGLYLSDSGFSVEGSSADANETTVAFTNPSADRTITFPDATGNVAVFATAPTTAISDGSNGQVLITNGSGVLSFSDMASGADLYAANESSPSAQPSATGTNAVAIGDSSISAGTRSVALGKSRASGMDSFAAAMGDNTTSYGALASFSVALGYTAKVDSSSAYSMAMGRGPQIVSSARAVAIGNNPRVTNADYAVAIGDEATVLSAESGVALGTSYVGGTDGFAAVIANKTSSYGATGANSIAIGRLSKASGADSFAIGDNNIVANGSAFALGNTNNVTGSTGFALGESHTVSGSYGASIGGYGSTATQTYAMTFGPYAKAAVQNAFIFGSKGWFSAGSAQGGMYILYADTTDATATVLTTTNSTAGSTNQIVAASDTCIMFSGTLVAMQNGAQDQGGWEIKGLLKNDGGTTTLVSSNIQTFDDGNGWVVALTADNTNNALAITCTGEASHNIRWVANIQTSEVTYA